MVMDGMKFMIFFQSGENYNMDVSGKIRRELQTYNYREYKLVKLIKNNVKRGSDIYQ